MQHKKGFILLIILVLSAAFNLLTVGAQDTEASVSVVPEVEQATAGQEFAVNVQVGNANQIYGISFKLTFDPQAFEVVKSDSGVVSLGALFEGMSNFAPQNAVDADTGTVNYAMTLLNPAPPVSGDGVAAVVTFRALKDAATAIVADDAKLVTPKFSESGGQMVAQQTVYTPVTIVQSPAVVAQAETSASTSAASSNTASVASASASVSGSSATAMFGSVPATASVKQSQQANGLAAQIPMIAAGVFFVVGLILLTLSVGMYSRMRVRFNVMAMKEIQPEQVF